MLILFFEVISNYFRNNTYEEKGDAMRIIRKLIYPLTIIIVSIVIVYIIYTQKHLKNNEYQDIIIETETKEEEPIVELKEDETYKVDIKGAVKHPGVYKVKKDNNINDVINLAGGLNKNADTSLINLAKKVKDEMVIIIYTKEEVENSNLVNTVIKVVEKECVCPNIENDSCINNEIEDTITNNDNKLININTATKLELMNSDGPRFSNVPALEEIIFGESEIQRICRLFSVTPVRENWIAQATFFNQFPGYDVCGRTYYYLSRIVSLAVSFEQLSTGLPRSDWGEGAISVFRTMSGSPYRFQFHISADESAVAHCCIVGPTGQGKTTLLTFLAGQAMRHEDLKVYFFDRHRGAEIFTHTVKGAYVGFSGERKNVSLNPFDTRDTASNRAFLRNWLKAITMANDALSEREAARAVTTAFDYLRPEERVLTNLYKSCFSPTGSMRRELFRWVNPDQYGNIFNAEHDSLDLSSNRFVAFDFTEIFDDETLAAASISYIMHRIQSESTETGTPALVMIDETAPMLKHEMFRDAFIKGLQEGRKKRQAYLCAFQQPNIVDTLGVGDAVRGQCKTMIFFRNTQATPESYEKWNLTASEYDFIQGKTFRDCPYAILLKRPDADDGRGESVILDVNLGGLGPYLKLYNSGIKNVLLVDSLVKEFGEDGFVTKYLNGIGG